MEDTGGYSGFVRWTSSCPSSSQQAMNPKTGGHVPIPSIVKKRKLNGLLDEGYKVLRSYLCPSFYIDDFARAWSLLWELVTHFLIQFVGESRSVSASALQLQLWLSQVAIIEQSILDPYLIHTAKLYCKLALGLVYDKPCIKRTRSSKHINRNRKLKSKHHSYIPKLSSRQPFWGHQSADGFLACTRPLLSSISNISTLSSLPVVGPSLYILGKYAL